MNKYIALINYNRIGLMFEYIFIYLFVEIIICNNIDYNHIRIIVLFFTLHYIYIGQLLTILTRTLKE